MTVTAVRAAGERAVVLEVDVPPASMAARIRHLAEAIESDLQDVVPGSQTVLVVAADPAHLARLLQALPRLDDEAPESGLEGTSDLVEIAVHYDGPDLTAVAEATCLGVDEIIRRHSAPTYVAAFTGFAPGFAYLTGLDPALALPRRANPRPKVPAGSVAVADRYAAVYPRSSPGGWHLLGTTDEVMFDPSRVRPALISPGTLVRFRALPGHRP